MLRYFCLVSFLGVGMNHRSEFKDANLRVARRLVVTVVIMFGFGYALVPLYDVLCEITGFSGRTGVVQAEDQVRVDTERLITVEFLANTSRDLNWEFRPMTGKMQVHPCGIYEVSYYAKNLNEAPTVGWARPSVSPIKASMFFNKTECFCFASQALNSGEIREMPVRFVVAENLPSEISTLTLSYTFFDVTEKG